MYIWERGAADGQLPYRDVAFEYPPIVGYLWAAIETIAGSKVMHVVLWAAVQAAAAGIAALVLSREAGRRRTLLYWSFAPQLFLYGSLNFETLAVAPLVLSVALTRRGRPIASAAALAVATATKLFPLALLPVVLARPLLSRDRRVVLAATATFTIVTAAAFVPGMGAAFSTLWSLARYSVGIEPNYDSVFGLMRSAVLIRDWDPRDAIVVVSLTGTAVTYLLLVVPALRRSADPAVASGLAIVVILLWTRLYSPQYALWILPLFALAIPSPRLFALLTTADLAVFFTVYPLTHAAGFSEGTVHLLTLGLTGAVVLRHVALLLTTRELWRRSATWSIAQAGGSTASGPAA